jgi:SHS2 domain-containing protein
MYEVFAHTADVGLRIRAPSLDSLFADAALGLFSLIVSNIDQVKLRDQIQITLPCRDNEYDYLLFDWLNELLYTFDSRQIVLAKFDVHVAPAQLHATAWGEPLDPKQHRLDHEVKAITYHELKVVRDADEWLAEVIVDI